MKGILSSTAISISGMSAERLRMETIANNIANANTTRGKDGLPYRRKEVVFSTVYDESLGLREDGPPSGVQAEVVDAEVKELPRVYDPSHPHADENGYVTKPAISIVDEMVDLVTANRSYEANLKVMRAFRQMAEQALSLLQRI